MRTHLLKMMLFALIVSSTLIAGDGNRKNEDSCKKEKYATAEPGTCLHPRAFRFLKAMEHIDSNPYNNEFATRLLNLLEPDVFKQIDTIVAYEKHNVPIRIYYPTRASVTTPTQVILFIHGGAFMYGGIEEYDMAVKKLARITKKIIISVDYRLAPEHPFPSALNDVDAVLDWAVENMETIGGKGGKIILMGDSAGANLATVLAIKCRNENRNIVLCQILYYPPTTFVENVFPSRQYFLRDERRTYLLTEELLLKTKESYLPDTSLKTNPYASPLLADLSGDLPPALIFTAQVDPLRDDGRRYADKLTAAGQTVTYIEYEGIVHGFLNLYMIFPEGKASMKLARDFIIDVNNDTNKN
jgi:acetyl esterase